MSAITAALSQIDRVAADGDLVPEANSPLELETAGEPIVLPDGKRIYPPSLHGAPVDELALALLDMHDPAASSFLRLIGPPGAGKSQIARAIAYRLWTGRGREVSQRHGVPFYGFVELQPGPSSDEFFFRYDYVPVAGSGGQVALVDSAFVQAMREGWVVMIDEVNTARDVALLSINATLDGRLSLYLAATGETVIAQPGFAVLLAYNPGLVGATDIPDAWHSRFPATLEVTSNWAALVAARRAGAARRRGDAARSPADRRRGRTVMDAAVPRHRIAVADERAGRRAGRARVLRLQPPRAGQAGKIQDAEAAAACRMLDQSGYGRLRVSRVKRTAEPARLPAGGDLMTPAGTTSAARPAVFVQQLHRAAAQRGRLDPVYQDLSDHWTQILQRLYPVWALIGPGLSDPGHIEIHSRTVYLDSEALLGSREAIAAGSLERRAILRCFGVALHETMHAKHTKRWAIEHDIALSESDDPHDRQLAVDRRLLEEPRMEAHGVREFPSDSLRGRFVRRALQAAVADVILPAFAEQVLELARRGIGRFTRDLAARATVYLQARTHYGIVDPADLTGFGRAVAGGARRTRPPRARRPVREGRVDPRRRARAARRGRRRVPANRRRA